MVRSNVQRLPAAAKIAVMSAGQSRAGSEHVCQTSLITVRKQLSYIVLLSVCRRSVAR